MWAYSKLGIISHSYLGWMEGHMGWWCTIKTNGTDYLNFGATASEKTKSE